MLDLLVSRRDVGVFAPGGGVIAVFHSSGPCNDNSFNYLRFGAVHNWGRLHTALESVPRLSGSD